MSCKRESGSHMGYYERRSKDRRSPRHQCHCLRQPWERKENLAIKTFTFGLLKGLKVRQSLTNEWIWIFGDEFSDESNFISKRFYNRWHDSNFVTYQSYLVTKICLQNMCKQKFFGGKGNEIYGDKLCRHAKLWYSVTTFFSSSMSISSDKINILSGIRSKVTNYVVTQSCDIGWQHFLSTISFSSDEINIFSRNVLEMWWWKQIPLPNAFEK